SALTLSNFDTPGTTSSFYPAAWHDFAALVVASTGAAIPVAANLLSAVIAVVLWPLSCVLLARQIFGRSPGAVAVAGGLSIGGAGEVLVVLRVLGAAWYWPATTSFPLFSSTRAIYWAPFETPAAAVGEVLLNATNGREALWLLSVVVLIGLVASTRTVEHRWL